MAARRSLLERLRQELACLPNVTERKMFDATAFLVNDKMCVCADENSIMCRVDSALHASAVDQPGCTAVVMRGREYIGYVDIQGEALESRAALRHWVDLALDFNKTAKRSKKTRG